ncbi:hypothetical protein [Streptomyces kronopolitis]|uniref:hypothetical protein n=1 Tax=Streptomyces kronopolitis TaxID=1612435 RepID=UPI0034188CB7
MGETSLLRKIAENVATETGHANDARRDGTAGHLRGGGKTTGRKAGNLTLIDQAQNS